MLQPPPPFVVGWPKTKRFVLLSFPTRMERYKILEQLGDGAFGVVVKAVTEAGEVVAIKRIKKRFPTWEDCLGLREVQSLTKLRHANIVRLKEVVHEKESGVLFFVFEYMPDGNLFTKLRSFPEGMPEEQVRDILIQVLAGLAHMHKHGFFHRDIKPENLLCAGDVVKIGDLGQARETRSRPPYTDYVSTRWYRAPEIIVGVKSYNSPVDMWAVGCIAVELVTGKPLFMGKTNIAQLYTICTVLGPPTATSWADGCRAAASIGIRLPPSSACTLNSLLPSASSEFLTLVTDMLQWDPNRRPTARAAMAYPFFAGCPPPEATPLLTARRLSDGLSTPGSVGSGPGSAKSPRPSSISLEPGVPQRLLLSGSSVRTSPAGTPVAATSRGVSSGSAGAGGGGGGGGAGWDGGSGPPSMRGPPPTRRVFEESLLASEYDAALESSIDRDIGALGLDSATASMSGLGGLGGRGQAASSSEFESGVGSRAPASGDSSSSSSGNAGRGGDRLNSVGISSGGSGGSGLPADGAAAGAKARPGGTGGGRSGGHPPLHRDVSLSAAIVDQLLVELGDVGK